MDFEITFVERGYFIIKTGGDSAPPDIEASLVQTFEHPKWRDGSPVLFDNRLENLGKLTSKDVQAIAGVFTKHNNRLTKSKVALVMPEDLAFGMARMWEAHTATAGAFETHVFRSLDEAVQWIEQS